MTPLERHLEDRQSAGVAARMRLLERAGFLPRRLHDLLWRRIWSDELRHQRSYAAGVSFDDDGRVMLRGVEVGHGTPLCDLLGPMGRPLTIVATGPTARDHDFDPLRRNERMVVAVNGATTFLREIGVTPDLWVITDPQFIESGARHFDNAGASPLVISGPAVSMLARLRPAELRQRRFAIISRVNAWFGVRRLTLHDLRQLNDASGRPFDFALNDAIAPKVGWSHAPWLGYFSACNVVFAALQIVVGLGAKDIQIVGMDLSGQRRVYDEGETPQPSALLDQYTKYILPSFELMHQSLKGSGVIIRNLSPVCPLPAEVFSLDEPMRI